ncbi:MAG: hypothetical protein JKX84_02915 [Flavobacteriales bacterium]|nr:hypothetical protein [Flavobacteriales bacterium]
MFFSNFCHAQSKDGLKDRWRNSIGVALPILINNGGASPAFGVFYNPQINIINRYADFSLAMTLPMTLGAHIKTPFVDQTFFFGHIPGVIEASLGHYSTRDFRSDIGMSLGAGYGAQITDRGLSSGFVATVSARTWVVRGSLTIRYMLHLNMQGNGYNTHSIVLAINMGNYFKKLVSMNKLSKFQNFK